MTETKSLTMPEFVRMVITIEKKECSFNTAKVAIKQQDLATCPLLERDEALGGLGKHLEQACTTLWISRNRIYVFFKWPYNYKCAL